MFQFNKTHEAIIE